jgi:DNA-directed RNA polymerase specialized sigma subunit
MTPKDYMAQANILIRRIERKRREAVEIRIKEGLPSSPSYSDMPKQTTHNPHQKSDNILRAIELDAEANIAFEELETLKSQFRSCIQKLSNPDDRDLLYKRYIEFKEWKKIAAEIGYSISHTKRLHGIAVKKLILDDTP